MEEGTMIAQWKKMSPEAVQTQSNPRKYLGEDRFS